MKNTKKIANRFVKLCNAGNFDKVYKELYAEDVISIEPMGAPIEIIKGLKGIRYKSQVWSSNVEEFHSTSLGEPIISTDHFAITWSSKITYKGQKKPSTIDEVCVYQVRDGKIVLEQFFYNIPPAKKDKSTKK